MPESSPVSASSISFNFNEDSRGDDKEDYNPSENGPFQTIIISILLFYIIAFLLMIIVLIILSLLWSVKYNVKHKSVKGKKNLLSQYTSIQ